MKVATINFSGNNGKTTLAEHVFAARMPGALQLTIETINAGNEDIEKVRGKDFGQMMEAVMLADQAIVDVGASNVEDTMKLMKQYSGSHEEFDYFVVPAVKESKQLEDTLATIQALSSLGVPAKKIRVVFNKVEVDDDVESDFYPLFAMHQAKKNFTLNPSAVVYSSDIYKQLRALKKSIPDLLEDPTDWRKKLKEAANEDEKITAVKMISLKRLAVSACENLDDVFKALTAK
ncbi:StbB family protein [Enterobacter kobei]|uniref:StbB family protein n=1 Tax=Enterobacter kobei TaxID=208224 RepID=UPI00064320CA|nr:StbB family protein [Enterobacter kobei]KLP75325.1 hypothetical protein ABR38_13315 [Enterobacter kobei]